MVTYFEIFSSLLSPATQYTLRSKKFQQIFILTFDAKSIKTSPKIALIFRFYTTVQS